MERKIKELLTNVKNESQEGMLERIKNNNVKEEDIYFMLKYFTDNIVVRAYGRSITNVFGTFASFLRTCNFRKTLPVAEVECAKVITKHTLQTKARIQEAMDYGFIKILEKYEDHNGDGLFMLNDFLDSLDRYNRRKIDILEVVSRAMHKKYKERNRLCQIM